MASCARADLRADDSTHAAGMSWCCHHYISLIYCLNHLVYIVYKCISLYIYIVCIYICICYSILDEGRRPSAPRRTLKCSRIRPNSRLLEDDRSARVYPFVWNLLAGGRPETCPGRCASGSFSTNPNLRIAKRNAFYNTISSRKESKGILRFEAWRPGI